MNNGRNMQISADNIPPYLRNAKNLKQAKQSLSLNPKKEYIEMISRQTKFDASLGRDYSEENVDGTPNFRAPPIKSPAQVAAEKKKLLEIQNQNSLLERDHDLRASFGNNSDRSDRRNSFYNFTNNERSGGALSSMNTKLPAG